MQKKRTANTENELGLQALRAYWGNGCQRRWCSPIHARNRRPTYVCGRV